jgi:SAM-dependent methyltransferase
MSERSNRTGDEGLDPAAQRRAVRSRYVDIATSADEGAADDDGADGNCCSDDGSCCDGDAPGTGSAQLGYDDSDLDAVADGADLGLGCGNPTAIASLDPGETVLDLGSGAGFDCFLAADAVGEAGTVIGVDMTPAMVDKARRNVEANDATNVEFRLGEIEHLPVADETVDAIISNCVINLSPNKPQVFREAYRVLRPGGRVAVSDVVETAPIPDGIRADPDSVAACVGGASTIEALAAMLDDAGFVDVAIAPKDDSEAFIREWDDDVALEEYLVSAAITGRKPGESE